MDGIRGLVAKTVMAVENMTDVDSFNCGGLHECAAGLGEVVESCFIDDSGWLRCNINCNTMKPFTEAELEPYEITSLGASKAERWTYEDTMFCSGLYLWALVEEFKVTGNDEVRSRGERFFDDLMKLIEQFNRIEPGYIGKPWGARPSRETTIDQTLYLCFGLHAYHSIADSSRQKKISETIVNNADWWIGRDYRNFQTPDNMKPVWLNPSHVSGTMSQVYLAHLHSSESKYLDECNRLIGEYGADEFAVRESPRWLPVGEDGLRVRLIALWHHAGALSLWLLADRWEERTEYWQERFEEQWHKELKLGLRPDGMAYSCLRVNVEDECEVPFGEHEAGFVGDISEAQKQSNSVGHSWASAAQSGCVAAHIAFSACLLADAVPRMKPSAREVIKRVIRNTDVSRFLRTHDPDGRQVYEKRRHWLSSLTSKGIAAWLLAYWMARRLRLLD